MFSLGSNLLRSVMGGQPGLSFGRPAAQAPAQAPMKAAYAPPVAPVAQPGMMYVGGSPGFDMRGGLAAPAAVKPPHALPAQAQGNAYGLGGGRYSPALMQQFARRLQQLLAHRRAGGFTRYSQP